jgi:hypothetical protein
MAVFIATAAELSRLTIAGFVTWSAARHPVKAHQHWERKGSRRSTADQAKAKVEVLELQVAQIQAALDSIPSQPEVTS